MQLGWIDFSKSERSKILSVLDMLSEAGTLDELGIAPIRDGFANLFFPGTSTIQTRAKYFFAVPYALKQLERGTETNPNKVLKELDTIERSCGELLLRQNSEEPGIIGKRSLQGGKWVKRSPADIYWAGLRQYGIFSGGNMSLAEYVRISCALKSQKSALRNLGNRNDNAEENECDDKNAGDIEKIQFWKMPLYREDWMSDFCMNLSDDEALFLKNQMIEHCEESMLGYILKNNLLEVLDCQAFHDIGCVIENFPAHMQEDFKVAVSFSRFIYAIRTVYNVILSDGNNQRANEELERQKEEFIEIANIDVDGIMDRLKIYHNPMLRKFLKQAKEYMQHNQMEELKKCITSREVQLKGTNRAKTTHPGEFNPEEWYGGGALDYRFQNAKVLLADIMIKEESHVKSQ